uniref:Uncharacterized protein n=1 Tax=Strigamia maritima TaxID=126957 RepID=T1JJA7_STRMM
KLRFTSSTRSNSSNSLVSQANIELT